VRNLNSVGSWPPIARTDVMRWCDRGVRFLVDGWESPSRHIDNRADIDIPPLWLLALLGGRVVSSCR
jgi:hypothetical protein